LWESEKERETEIEEKEKKVKRLGKTIEGTEKDEREGEGYLEMKG